MIPYHLAFVLGTFIVTAVSIIIAIDKLIILVSQLMQLIIALLKVKMEISRSINK